MTFDKMYKLCRNVLYSNNLMGTDLFVVRVQYESVLGII